MKEKKKIVFNLLEDINSGDIILNTWIMIKFFPLCKLFTDSIQNMFCLTKFREK